MKFRTDTERFNTVERVLARKAQFAEVDPKVAEVFAAIEGRLADYVEATRARTVEEAEDRSARVARDQAAERVQQMLRWANDRLDDLMTHDWATAPDPRAVNAAADSLFPAGVPSLAETSAATVRHAATEFLSAVGSADLPTYPEAFLADLRADTGALTEALAEVGNEVVQTASLVQRIRVLRDEVDRDLSGLEALVQGFTILAGEPEKAALLFRGVDGAEG